MGDKIIQKAESERETNQGDMHIARGNQIERARLGRDRDRDSKQEQTIWTKGNQGQEAGGIDSSLSTWEQHRKLLEAGNMILQAGHPLSTPRNILFLLLLSVVLSSAKLSQVVVDKDTSDKTGQAFFLQQTSPQPKPKQKPIGCTGSIGR